MSLTLAPSILAADFLKLEEELAPLAASSDNVWIHLDIMDGHFVPNLSYGMPIIEAVRKKYPHFKFDAHLMVTNPDFYLDAFANKNKFNIYNWTMHYEALTGITYKDNNYGAFYQAQPAALRETSNRQIEDLLQAAKKIYPSVGIALRPHTPLEVLTKRCLEIVDLILLMSVEPGFAGQKFMPSVLPKLQQLADLRQKMHAKWQIQVDGGVNFDTIKQLSSADNLVVGAALFKNPPYPNTLQQLANNYATYHS